MPTRLVREGILNSERVNELSERAELFYRKLMSVVDDYGRIEVSLPTLLGRLYAHRLDSVGITDLANWLSECTKGDQPLVITYCVKGKRYLQIQDFRQQAKSKSKCPEPESVQQPPEPVNARSLYSESESKTNAKADSKSETEAPPLSGVDVRKADVETFADEAEAVYGQHLKKKHKFLAMGKLQRTFADDFDLWQWFREQHAKWVAFWREEIAAGASVNFIPALCNPDDSGFIADELWKTDPPVRAGPKLSENERRKKAALKYLEEES